MKECELYKVKADPDSGYDLDSIELSHCLRYFWSGTGMEPRVIIILSKGFA